MICRGLSTSERKVSWMISAAVVSAALTTDEYSICTAQSARVRTDRHLVVAIPGDTRKGRLGMGVRAGVGDCELLRRGQDGD